MKTRFGRVLLLILMLGGAQGVRAQQRLIPGSGVQLKEVGDSFEGKDWSYKFRLPKSTQNLDGSTGGEGGESTNDRWYEGPKRGQPDVIKTVPTPKGGLPGSTRSLLLRSLHTGVRGEPSFRMQQDDFIGNVNYRLDGGISVERSPSVTARVFLPKVAEWEKRTGCQFAFRVAVNTTVQKRARRFFSSPTFESETYWPGFFVDFQSKEDNGLDYDTANLRIRGNAEGEDFKGPQIRTTGWWTFGISCSPDGMIHYFAKPGVEELTAADHITSQLPYGVRCEEFETFFFNVCNGDDGRTWSTAWIIDDPKVFTKR